MASIYSMVDNHFAELDRLYDSIELLNQQIDDALEENGGEETELISAMVGMRDEQQTKLKQLEEVARKEVLEKIDDYGRWLKNIQSDKEAMKKEESRIAARRRSAERKEEWVKGNILYGMNASEEQKIAGTLFTASIRNNKSTEVDEEAALAPFRKLVDDFFSSLPSWLSFSPKFNKTEAKKLEVLPAGFTMVSSQSLTVK